MEAEQDRIKSQPEQPVVYGDWPDWGLGAGDYNDPKHQDYLKIMRIAMDNPEIVGHAMAVPELMHEALKVPKIVSYAKKNPEVLSLIMGNPKFEGYFDYA